MIQRIQSIWLLLASAGLALLFFMPLFTVETEGTKAEVYNFIYSGFYDSQNNQISPSYVYTGVLAATLFLVFINIFLFKKRVLQMRICVFSGLMILVLIGLAIYYAYFSMEKTSVAYEISFFMPVLSLIFILMARRGIFKDEMLVRSVDRIR